jgi:hypothetical protein
MKIRYINIYVKEMQFFQHSTYDMLAKFDFTNISNSLCRKNVVFLTYQFPYVKEMRFSTHTIDSMSRKMEFLPVLMSLCVENRNIYSDITKI